MVALVKKTGVSSYTFYNGLSATVLFGNNFNSNGKGMEHVPNIFMSFYKYLFLEVIEILI